MSQLVPFTACRSRFARLAFACIAWLPVAACGDGTGPGRDGGDRLVPGRAVEGTVGGAQAREARFFHDAPPNQFVEVEFRSDGDSIGLALDHANGETSFLVASDRPAGDTTTRWLRFTAPAEGRTLRFRVATRAGGGGRFHLVLHAQDRNPESRPAAIEFDHVIEERLDSPIDVDVYRFTLLEPLEIVVTAQLVDPVTDAACFTARVRSYPDTTARQGAIGCLAPPGIPFEQVEPTRSTLPPGPYQLIVDRDALSSGPARRQTPRYRVRVRAIPVRPEGVSESLALGDTVASSIGGAGDVDQFVVRSAPGDRILAFLQSTTPGARLRLRRPGVPPDVEEVDVTTTEGAPLLAGGIGPLVVPSDGALWLRVEGATGATVGGYRIVAIRADSLPEGRAAAIALDETVVGRIEAPGDVDTYLLDVPRPASGVMYQLVNVTLTIPQPVGTDSLLATFVAVPFLAAAPAAVNAGSLRAGSGRLSLPLGAHVLRVSGKSARGDAYFGPYTLRVTSVDFRPESRAYAIAVGDSAPNERLDPAGDLDTYGLLRAPGDTFRIRLVNRAPGAPFPLTFVTVDSDNWRHTVDLGPDPDERVGLRIDPGHGIVRFEVSGLTTGRDLDETAPYRLVLERLASTPERRGEQAAVGDTIRGERLDYRGDVDGFTVTGPPGQEVVIELQGTPAPNSLGRHFFARAFEQETGTRLASVMTAGAAASTQVRMPASGRLRLDVSEFEPICFVSKCIRFFALAGDYTIVTRLAAPAATDR